MSNIRIPLELVERILEDRTIDKSSLQSCALVCRSWVSSVRQRLFYKFYIISTTDFDDFAKILESSPGIAHCVRYLSFKISPVSYSNQWVLVIASICAKFMKVETFEWYGYHFLGFSEAVNRQMFQSLKPIMATATHLIIEGIHFFDKSELLCRFISACPHVTRLDLKRTGYGNYTCTFDPQDLLASLPPPSASLPLRSLRMIECYGNISPLLRTITSELRSLSVRITHNLDLKSEEFPVDITAFPSLKFLESFEFEEEPSVGHYELCKFTGMMPVLKEFKAKFYLKSERAAYDKVEWITRVLSNLPSTIRKIFIVVKGNVDGLCAMDWNPLDRVFERSDFYSLKNITIAVETYAMIPEIKFTLLDGLMKLRSVKRRRVQVVHWESDYP